VTERQEKMPWRPVHSRPSWLRDIRVPSRRPNKLENAPPEGEQDSANNGSGLERGNEID
jgi:hypothetical protein